MAVDGKGNVAGLLSVGGEGTTPAIGGGFQIQITNAESVESLKGWGVSGGGSATVLGVGAGIDYETSTNPDGTEWSGIVISVGANNVFAPLEVHGDMSYTWEKELTDEQISDAKNEISNKLKWLNDNLSDEAKERIKNIIGGDIFKIE